MSEFELGYFRVMIEMALEEEVELEGDETPESANGYYQCFSVTAASYAEAVAFVEEALGDLVTENPETAGWLVQMEIDTWSEPAGGDADTFLQNPTQAGVHFVSHPAFFLGQQADD